MANLDQIKSELIAAARQLSLSGVMFRGEHANLSARLDNDNAVITTGGNVGNLDEDSFAVVDLNGQVVRGEVNPTTAEIVQMHTAVYRHKSTVGSVIHVHAPHATAFAVAHQAIPVVYEPLTRFGIAESIPVVPWAPRGSEASVDGILDVITSHPDLPVVLLANHGVLAFAENPTQTAQLLATVDEAAEVVINARRIGGEKHLPDEAFMKIKERMQQFVHS